MILYSVFQKQLERIPQRIAPILWIAFFAVTKYWVDHITVRTHWLWLLGFQYDGFYSADYVPFLPWSFLFLLGIWFGGVLQRHRTHRLLNVQCPVWLTWPGRHTLLIYLLHQPVLYGIFMLAVH
jgi:uncharacterized membrane protein